MSDILKAAEKHNFSFNFLNISLPKCYQQTLQ